MTAAEWEAGQRGSLVVSSATSSWRSGDWSAYGDASASHQDTVIAGQLYSDLPRQPEPIEHYPGCDLDGCEHQDNPYRTQGED